MRIDDPGDRPGAGTARAASAEARMRIDDPGDRPGASAPARTPDQPSSGVATAEPTPAETRFQSCRWSVTDDGPPYCANPEVLPYAGKGGFNVESWCLDCTLYKLRRKASKRRRRDDDFPY